MNICWPDKLLVRSMAIRTPRIILLGEKTHPTAEMTNAVFVYTSVVLGKRFRRTNRSLEIHMKNK